MNQNNIYHGQGYEDEQIVDGMTLRILRGMYGSFDSYDGKGLFLHLEQNHRAKRKFHDLFIPERKAKLLLKELGETSKRVIQPGNISAHFNAQREVVAVSA